MNVPLDISKTCNFQYPNRTNILTYVKSMNIKQRSNLIKIYGDNEPSNHVRRAAKVSDLIHFPLPEAPYAGSKCMVFN